MKIQVRLVLVAMFAVAGCAGADDGSGTDAPGHELVIGGDHATVDTPNEAAGETIDAAHDPSPAEAEVVAADVAEEALPPTDVPDVVGDEIAAPDEGVTTDEGVTGDEGVTKDEGVTTDVAKDEGTTPTCNQCNTVSSCFALCAKGDGACQDNCVAGLCTPDQGRFLTFNTCMGDNGCIGLEGAALSTCLDDYCRDQYFSCYSGDKYPTCIDLRACLTGCPDDDPLTSVDENLVCLHACLMGATKTANWDFKYMNDCIDGECPICSTATTQAEDDQCSACYNVAIFKSCGIEAQKCVEFGTSYPDCIALTDCLDACAKGDTACLQACIDGATFQAAKDYELKFDCVDANCPDCAVATPTQAQTDACNTCWEAKVVNGTCQAWYQACKEHGTTKCQAVWSCINACQTTPCQAACFDTGTFAAQDKLSVFEDCAFTYCPTGTFSCMNGTRTVASQCKTQWAACAAN